MAKQAQKLIAVSPAGNEYELSAEAYHNALARGYKPKSEAVAQTAAALGTDPKAKTAPVSNNSGTKPAVEKKAGT